MEVGNPGIQELTEEVTILTAEVAIKKTGISS